MSLRATTAFLLAAFVFALLGYIYFVDGEGYNPYYDLQGSNAHHGSESYSATSDLGKMYYCNGGYDRCGFLEDRSNNWRCARQKIFNNGTVVRTMKNCYVDGPTYASWTFNGDAHQACSERYADGRFGGCGIKSLH